MAQTSSNRRNGWRWIGLIGGPLAAVACYLWLPTNYRIADGTVVPFDAGGRATLAVMAWMAVWWITEALDISVTALLPLVLFPVLGIASMEDAAKPYAHPLVFLFMGGFLIAIAMHEWGLDRRIALQTLRVAGTRPPFIVGGFMLTTAALSAFVSNTATTAMMVPIAFSVIRLVRNQVDSTAPAANRMAENLTVALLLGIAYAASIGGVATIIGTPPNAFLVAFLSESIAEPYRVTISFDHWLWFGVPVVVIMLPLTWLLLTGVLFPVGMQPISGGRSLVRTELQKLGRMGRGELATLIVFMLTATCWILKRYLVQWSFTVNGHEMAPLAGLTDPGIAVGGALLLFLVPVQIRNPRFALEWKVASQLPWGILLLFGGGLSLAAAVKANGVAEFIGSQAFHFAGMPNWVVILVVTTMVVFLTELTSNLATTATLLPVLAALAPGLGLHPLQLVIPATISASCAFMMPVATPPNAIVFGSGEVRISHMIKAGIWLNLFSIIMITVLTTFWFTRLLAADM